jgi:VWFA-related protein
MATMPGQDTALIRHAICGKSAIRPVGKRGRWLAFAATCLFLFACGVARAQSAGPITPPPQKVAAPAKQPAQNQPTPKISQQVNVVVLYVTVRDKHGKIVTNLNQQDFTVAEDGHPQPITAFYRETDLPLTLGLLVDTSLSQRDVLDNERDASYTFLDQMLREDKDQAFVIHFDREVELLQDLTGSRPKLQAALQLLQTPQPQFSNVDNGNSGGNGNGNDGGNTTDPDENVPVNQTPSNTQQRNGRMGGGTLLYDAIYLASNDEMKKLPGRKAIFVMSDGVDRGSKESLTDAIAAAQRADTAVYSILFAGHESNDNDNPFGRHGGWGMGGPMGWPGGGGGGGGGRRRYPEERTDGKKILQRISTETGGQFFQVSKKLPLDQVYKQVEDELRNQYSLGYKMPDHSSSGPGYHKITLTTKNKDLTVQVRDGYYSTN